MTRDSRLAAGGCGWRLAASDLRLATRAKKKGRIRRPCPDRELKRCELESLLLNFGGGFRLAGRLRNHLQNLCWHREGESDSFACTGELQRFDEGGRARI